MTDTYDNNDLYYKRNNSFLKRQMKRSFLCSPISFCDHYPVCMHTCTHAHKSVGRETKINKNQK